MNWTTGGDLKAQLSRLWDKGELPREVVTGETGFPVRLVLKGPNSSDLTGSFEAVRRWSSDLSAAPRIRIEYREVRHRVQGLQRIPDQAWIDSLDDALALLGRRREAERLVQLVQLTRARLPALLPWLSKRPLQALDLAEQWPRLMAVVQWVVAHPRPGVYLRQVDAPGVHSKFIEAHRSVLSELLDLALPAHAIAPARGGASQFASRYGFLDKPARIRLRVLDRRLWPWTSGAMAPDVMLDTNSFAGLDIPVDKVFITENETNFLAFPETIGAIVVFGAGYGWEALAHARWLANCPIHYWGDIDTHGFAILNQLRGHFDHVSSIMMDRETLIAHEINWGEEPAPIRHNLPRLTALECAVYDDLRDHRLQHNLRLEQERVGFQWVTETLARLSKTTSP